jgi:hypothetical protein
VSLISKSLFLLLIPLKLIAAPGDASVAAEYYFLHHDYKQALALWEEVYKERPTNTQAITRLAELKLMNDGHLSLREFFLGKLDLQTRKNLKDRFVAWQSTFVSEEAQSTYLQAKPKLQYKDWPGALILLNQANSLEKGNSSILKDKARCEKMLDQSSRFYETLKSAYEANPFDTDILEELLESHVYFHHYDEAVSIAMKDSERISTLRSKTAFAVALMEKGRHSESWQILKSLADDKSGAVPIIAYYAMGKNLLGLKMSQPEALQYLEKFTASVAGAKELPKWDPYRVVERAEDAKAVIAASNQL